MTGTFTDPDGRGWSELEKFIEPLAEIAKQRRARLSASATDTKQQAATAQDPNTKSLMAKLSNPEFYDIKPEEGPLRIVKPKGADFVYFIPMGIGSYDYQSLEPIMGPAKGTTRMVIDLKYSKAEEHAAWLSHIERFCNDNKIIRVYVGLDEKVAGTLPTGSATASNIEEATILLVKYNNKPVQ